MVVAANPPPTVMIAMKSLLNFASTRSNLASTRAKPSRISLKPASMHRLSSSNRSSFQFSTFSSLSRSASMGGV
jgi:hypothetical protein